MIYKNLSIIVAIAENFAIGKNNDLLFYLPNDLKRFKKITSGHPVIMGKNTLLSLPKWPLPNRTNIVLTSNKDLNLNGCITVNTVEEAIKQVKPDEEAFVMGGGIIYEQFYPLAGKMYLTVVHKDFEADTFFPEIDFNDWEELEREDLYDEKNNFHYSYITLKRK